jgi:transcriptional regulator with XRE-family HTH domain
MDPFITTAEIAQRLGISTCSVNGWAKGGRLPIKRLGRDKWHRAEFERWLREGSTQQPAQAEPKANCITIDAGNGVTIDLCITIRTTQEQAITALRSVR